MKKLLLMILLIISVFLVASCSSESVKKTKTDISTQTNDAYTIIELHLNESASYNEIAEEAKNNIYEVVKTMEKSRVELMEPIMNSNDSFSNYKDEIDKFYDYVSDQAYWADKYLDEYFILALKRLTEDKNFSVETFNVEETRINLLLPLVIYTSWLDNIDPSLSVFAEALQQADKDNLFNIQLPPHPSCDQHYDIVFDYIRGDNSDRQTNEMFEYIFERGRTYPTSRFSQSHFVDYYLKYDSIANDILNGTLDWSKYE